jgi:hypothetical protein
MSYVFFLGNGSDLLVKLSNAIISSFFLFGFGDCGNKVLLLSPTQLLYLQQVGIFYEILFFLRFYSAERGASSDLCITDRQ